MNEKVDPSEILTNRLRAQYKKYKFPYRPERLMHIECLFQEMPLSIQEQLVDSDFLLRDKAWE